MAASVPSAQAFGGANAPRLEHYEPARAYAYSNNTQADRAGVLRQEALEARNKTWLGRSTVRTLSAGHRFQLTDGPLDALAAPSAFERATFALRGDAASTALIQQSREGPGEIGWTFKRR